MKDIIIWIVFIAVGALWEFVGRKKGSSASDTPSASVGRAADRPAPASRSSVPAPYSGTSRPAPHNSSSRPAPYSGTSRPAPYTATPRPAPAYTPLPDSAKDMPLQQVEVLPDTPLTEPIPLQDTPMSPDATVDDATRREREAHFRRWRQAIIDTQVLERKF